MSTKSVVVILTALCLVVLLTVPWARKGAEAFAGASAPSDEADIEGVVTSANGPEAGVWVIAETTDLPTRYVKIVVTDERGRYALPDLPQANYNVWVRGYGLVDSPRT